MSQRRHHMNYPPEHGIRVPVEALESFVARLYQAVGMSPADAATMARLQVDTDQHCVFSHGTRQAGGYLRMLRDGQVNPRPRIRTDADFPAGLVVDGDGGMGHLSCHLAMLACIRKAGEVGVAAATTRNHFHFGAAGKYTRLAVAAGCVGIAMSSHRHGFESDGDLAAVDVVSPMSIGIPADPGPPLVLDMGGMRLGRRPRDMEEIPQAVYKSLGLSMAIVSLGGMFAGIYREAYTPPTSPWESNQGALLIVLDVAHFLGLDELRAEMGRYLGAVRGLRPLPGDTRTETAGSAEWRWAAESRKHGIPMSDEHCGALRESARELGVDAPFAEFESTRF